MQSKTSLSLPLTFPQNIYQRSIGDLLTHFRWKTSIVICIWNKITYFLPVIYLHLLFLQHRITSSSHYIVIPLLLDSFSCSSPPWHHRRSKFPIQTRKQTQLRVTFVLLPRLALKIVYEWLPIDISIFALPTYNQYLRQIKSEFCSSSIYIDSEFYKRIGFAF